MPVVYLLNPCHHGENLRVEQPTDVIPKDTFHIRQLRRPLTHTPLLSVIYIYVVENLKGRNKRTAKQNQKPRRLVLVLEEHDRAAAASKQRSESSLNFSDCRRRRRGPFSTRRVLIQWRRGRRSVAFLLGSIPHPNPSSTQNVSVFFLILQLLLFCCVLGFLCGENKGREGDKAPSLAEGKNDQATQHTKWAKDVADFYNMLPRHEGPATKSFPPI